MKRTLRSLPSNRQRGVVLFVSLILLLILTLIAVTAARLQTSEERIARNEHNKQLALQAAEAVLRNTETTLWDGLYSTPDFASNSNGLYELRTEITSALGSTTPVAVSMADSINWFSPGTSARTYAGPALSDVPAAASVPVYIIENLPPVSRPGEPICTPGYGQEEVCSVYRITAHAFGADSTSGVTLQSIFH